MKKTIKRILNYKQSYQMDMALTNIYSTPFIRNGFNKILLYLPEGITDRTYGASLGIAITSELNQPECTMIFKVTGNFINETVIPGFIVRDTINGGAFKITFPEGLIVQEDDVLDLVIAYSWRQDPISTPQ